MHILRISILSAEGYKKLNNFLNSQNMKKVFVAEKTSFGTEFTKVCNSLEELKEAIVHHELLFEDDNYTDILYTEELFKKHSTYYRLFEVDLHPEEAIVFSEYDGQSWFSIEKIEPNILSTCREIEESQ